MCVPSLRDWLEDLFSTLKQPLNAKICFQAMVVPNSCPSSCQVAAMMVREWCTGKYFCFLLFGYVVKDERSFSRILRKNATYILNERILNP